MRLLIPLTVLALISASSLVAQVQPVTDRNALSDLIATCENLTSIEGSLRERRSEAAVELQHLIDTEGDISAAEIELENVDQDIREMRDLRKDCEYTSSFISTFESSELAAKVANSECFATQFFLQKSRHDVHIDRGRVEQAQRALREVERQNTTGRHRRLHKTRDYYQAKDEVLKRQGEAEATSRAIRELTIKARELECPPLEDG